MSLRRQLLLVSLLLLSLPWAGCQFISEMEGALRQGQEQSLQATATAIASVLGAQPQLIYPDDKRRGDVLDSRVSIYASPIDQALIVDGYADGWEDILPVSFNNASTDSALAVSYQAVTRGSSLYLLLTVQDPDLIYHNPGLSREPNGDRVILRTWQNNRRQEYAVATAAPGSVRARAASRRERGVDAGRIRGYWQDAVGGYTLELEIPLSYTGDRLGFYVIDAAEHDGERTETVGNVTSLETAAPPWLVYNPQALQKTLAAFGRQGKHIKVVDQHHWLIADLPPVDENTANGYKTFWLLQLLYRNILSEDEALTEPPAPPEVGKIQSVEIDAALSGNSANHRYRAPNTTARTYLSSATPIIHNDRFIGAVVVSQSGEQYLSLTDQAFSRLLGYSLFALGIGVLGLLGYASLLSWRIGKLSRAARDIVAEDGSIKDNFPRSTAADEIGELSRHYADLLDTLRDHNEYLRTLSRKLSHELRTPIALIQTSLEHLNQGELSTQEQETYLQRAGEGLARLGKILTAMSEASHLEESLRNNPLQSLDLLPLLREVSKAYQTLYRNNHIEFSSELESAPATVAGDLLVQALDKLMDNAATFTPEGGRIVIALQAADDFWAISISNEGPPLPDSLHTRLFEPMVSLREDGSKEVHLGLGLHIVRLIAEYHGGQVLADNLPEYSGARFTLLIPVTEDSSTE